MRQGEGWTGRERELEYGMSDNMEKADRRNGEEEKIGKEERKKGQERMRGNK